MEELLHVENGIDGMSVQYDVSVPDSDIAEVDRELDMLQSQMNEIDQKIDHLTNKSDWIDYTIAASSGVICGLIDTIFVDDFSIDKANEWGNEKTNKFVVWIAKKRGYQKDDLEGAVSFLQNKYKFAADSVLNQFGSGRQHHLRDFSHHPTPIGLFFSLLTQFTKKVYGTDVNGRFMPPVDLPENAMILVGNNTHEKIVFGVINWFFHMVSDMAGSASSISQGKVGTGLPGPIVSLLKEVSSLPIFKKTNKKDYKEFSVWISKLFNGTLLGDHNENGKIISARKFDLRTEIGVFHQLGKQAVPVLINECVVRAFYFIRRFVDEVRQISSVCELKNINWRNTVPAKNRTIERMLTISSGVFMAIDLTGAAIEALIASKGSASAFFSKFIVKVNIVGVGRFALAIETDARMGWKKSKLETERRDIQSRMMYYYEAKVFYRLNGSLEKASDVGQAIDGLVVSMKASEKRYSAMISEMSADSTQIMKNTDCFIKNNADTVEEINRVLSEV